jgi:glycerol uptake facilitator-like aquaporin
MASEALGSTLLAATVIGSGILALELSGGNDGVALLGNTLATAAMLYVLVAALGPVSGAHFNPVVTLIARLHGEIGASEALARVGVQVTGCIAGAWLAHAMFDQPLIQLSATERSGISLMLAEGVATFMLVFAILAGRRFRVADMPAIVALTIAAGYWWTSSTSFANPAITLARSLSDTFAGVRPVDAPGFIASQFIGGLAAHALGSWLLYGARR